ncbi:MAG: ATP-binding cassette domain-containing protein [Planctomycetes bacterium]|nr:ATP-binding cassette domain-containing protein [Planctomycetota bacterium]MBI3843203.1 ATP-binding cassette domain-containing protein [Planctomycetota bacterium]
MTPARIELHEVSKAYGDVASLRSVSFEMESGNALAIIGRSGSGKSTLLRLIAGLEPPSAGRVIVDGRIASEPNRVLLPPHARGLSMVFQDLALWPNLSVRENVELGLMGSSLSRRDRRVRAVESLRACAIEAVADRKPVQVSGGQQQRAALARALAVRPAFLLLDEPFSGVDLVTKAELLDEIGSIVREQKVTAVLVTHDTSEALALCRSAIVLEEGALVESGSFAELFREPRSEVLRAFQRQFAVLSAGQGTPFAPTRPVPRVLGEGRS